MNWNQVTITWKANISRTHGRNNGHNTIPIANVGRYFETLMKKTIFLKITASSNRKKLKWLTMIHCPMTQNSKFSMILTKIQMRYWIRSNSLNQSQTNSKIHFLKFVIDQCGRLSNKLLSQRQYFHSSKKSSSKRTWSTWKNSTVF